MRKNFLIWNKGRQTGEYYKMALLPSFVSKFLNTDAYLLKFPDGASVPKHKDPVDEGYKHIRMNITLLGLRKFKNRMYILGPIKRWWRIEIFRPDMYYHGLKPITGDMLMLSIGIKIRNQ